MASTQSDGKYGSSIHVFFAFFAVKHAHKPFPAALRVRQCEISSFRVAKLGGGMENLGVPPGFSMLPDPEIVADGPTVTYPAFRSE